MGEADEDTEGQLAETGPGRDQHHEKGCAHTQRVLNVDQPAIEVQKLGHQNQLVRHRLVRSVVPRQERFALLSS